MTATPIQMIPPRTWQFVTKDKGLTWSWRRLEGDGTMDSLSPPFNHFGKLMADVTHHGFSAFYDTWEVHSHERITRYRRGEAPKRIISYAPPLAIQASWAPTGTAGAD